MKNGMKAFVFDMGGTLEDVFHDASRNREIGEKVLAYLSRHGMPIEMDPEEFLLLVEARSKEYRAWGMDSMRELTPFEIWSQWFLKGLPFDEARLRIVANNIADIWERSYFTRSLRPESPALLHALKQRGYKLGVISNTACLTQVIEILHEYGLHQYFESIYMSSLSGFRKPHIGLFHAVAADLGVPPAECVYVGDTISRDVRGSRAAGYGACVRIESRLTGQSDNLYVKKENEEEADLLVSNLLEILNVY